MKKLPFLLASSLMLGGMTTTTFAGGDTVKDKNANL